MKNFFKTLIILFAGFLAIFSIIGALAYLAYYFLSGNSNIAKRISERISGFSEDKEDLLDEDEYLTDSEDELSYTQEMPKTMPEESRIIVPENIETEIVTVDEPIVKAVPKAQVVRVKAEKKPAKNKYGLNPRQNDLLKFIKNNDASTMYDISKVFSKVTQRTLRRDLEKLEKTGLVKQDGKTRNSVYKLL